MNRSLSLFAVAVLVAGAFLVVNGGWPPEAKALDRTLGTLQGGAAVTSCGTTATKIAPRTATMSPRSIVVVNNSATSVWVGGSTVDATDGVSVCNSGCDFTTSFQYDGQTLYCIASGSAQDVKVLWAP